MKVHIGEIVDYTTCDDWQVRLINTSDQRTIIAKNVIKLESAYDYNIIDSTIGSQVLIFEQYDGINDNLPKYYFQKEIPR